MSKTVFEISPAYRELLSAGGLDSFSRLFGYQGGQFVDGHRDRNVVRLVLKASDGQDVAIYLKREWNPKIALLVRRWLPNIFRPPPSRSRREWQNLRTLAGRSIAAAEPVAMGEYRRGGFFKRALLAVREVPRAINLAEYLQTFPDRPAADQVRSKHALAREVGAFVRRMHDSGMAYRDLYAKHIYVSPSEPGGSFRPTLIDAQRAHRFPHLSPHHRWRDLAALAVTTRFPACTATDRLRFVLAYTRQTRLAPAAKEMIARVAARSEKLSGRGLDPRLLQARHEAPPGMVPTGQENFRHIDGHRIVVVERFLGALKELGLDTVEAVMAYRGGQRFREVPDRLTVRIPFTRSDGGKSAIYLKRHLRVDAGAWLDGLLFWRKPLTRAEAEYRNIFHLIEHGIATPQTVAMGQDHRWSIRQGSFLMTEEISGGLPADDFLKEHFAARGSDFRKKRLLVRQIARLARRFHGAGFYHRDFYLCHFFVRPWPTAGQDPPCHPEGQSDEAGVPCSRLRGHADAEPEAVPYILHLIDLQRVRHCRGRKVGRRWIVKDLAALAYSAPAGVITRTDKVRFLREYFAADKLDVTVRDLIRSIVRKTRRIARHDANLQARRRQ